MTDKPNNAEPSRVTLKQWVEPVIEVIEAADAEGSMGGGGGESGRYS